MQKSINSTVASELVDRLCDLRTRHHWKDKELAAELKVNPTTLSKRLRDRVTTPDDSWIARLSIVAELTSDETAKMLVRASMERSEASRPALRTCLRKAWDRIHQNIYIQSPQSSLPPIKDEAQILRETFEAIGLKPRGRTEKMLVEFKGPPLSEISFTALWSLYKSVAGEIQDSDGKEANFGEFSQLLRVKLGVRQLPLAKTLLSRLSSSRIPGAETRSLPLLPGIFVHLFKTPEGQETPVHQDDGLEAILVLKGCVEIIFEKKLPIRLDGARPELLMYEASMRHGGKCLSDAEVLIVHYSPKLARKWESVERVYAEELQTEETSVPVVEMKMVKGRASDSK